MVTQGHVIILGPKLWEANRNLVFKSALLNPDSLGRDTLAVSPQSPPISLIAGRISQLETPHMTL
jgi:hypothetical protein